jgi:metallophosphoesterase superfamily enzyme
VEPAAVGGDDEGEVGLVDDPVDPRRAVRAADVVLAHGHPAVLVDGEGGDLPDGGRVVVRMKCHIEVSYRSVRGLPEERRVLARAVA